MSTQKNLIEILINLIDKSAPGLAGASKNLKSFGDGADKLGKNMMKAGSIVSGAMLGMVKVAANAGDGLRDMSIKTGVSVEVLSGLKYAAEQSGSGIEALATGLKIAAVNMASARDKTSASRKTFDELGISVLGADGRLRSLDSVLLELADKLQGMQDKTLKAAYAQAIFGRSGQDLIPLLDEGSAGIKRLTEEASRLGVVWSREDVNAADAFNDSLNKLKNASLGVSRSLLATLGPTLTDIAETISTKIVPAFTEWIEIHPKAAQSVAVLSLALVGAGGLVLALGNVANALVHIIVLAPSVVKAFAAMKAAALAAGITGAGTALAAGAAIGAPMVGGYILARESVGKGQRNTALAPVGAEGIGPLIMNAIFDLAQRSADKIKGTSLSGLDALPSFMGIAGKYAVEKVEAAGGAVKKWATDLELAVGKLAMIGDPQLKDFGLEGIFSGGKFDEALAKIVENADPFKNKFPGSDALVTAPVGPEVPAEYESAFRNAGNRAARAKAADPWAQLTARMTEAKTGIQTWLDTIQGAVENVGNRIGNVFADAFMNGKLSLRDFGQAFKATMADVIAQIIAASVKMAAFNLIIKLAGGGSPLSFSDALNGNSAGSGVGVGMDPISKAARGSSMRQNTDSTSMLKTGLDNLATKFDQLASVVVQIPGGSVNIDGRAAGRMLMPWMMEAQARGQS